MKRVHLISGRGGGKTRIAVVLVLRVCLDDPHTEGLVTAPTVKAMSRGFLKAWKKTVPSSLYKHKISEGKIEIINGSSFWLGSRYIDSPSRGKEEYRGPDIDWWLDDEAALGFDPEFHTNTCAAIRAGGKYRFYAATTTPRLGMYNDFMTSPGHVVINSTTMDNPHLPAGYVEDLLATMSKRQAQREIYGQAVALEGMVWDTWSDDPWPKGNIHQHRFDPSLPWYLFLDLGVGNGAYVVVQRLPANVAGNEIFHGSVWVAVAQVTPAHDGSASRALKLLQTHFGNPVHVVAGADIHTRASTDAKTSAYFVEQIYGAVPITPITGWLADKQIQYDRLDYLICDGLANRRFCASDGLVTIGDSDRINRRGVIELMSQDTWPENAGKVRGVFLEKEGRLEHIRDALLYGAVGLMDPPNYGKSGRLAA